VNRILGPDEESRDLKALVDSGLLVGEGETKGRVYSSSNMLREIYLRNYDPRTNTDPFTQDALPFPREGMAV